MEEEVKLSMGTCRVSGYTNMEFRKIEIRGTMIASDVKTKKDKILKDKETALSAFKDQDSADYRRSCMLYDDMLDSLDDQKAEDLTRMLFKAQAKKFLSYDIDLGGLSLWLFIAENFSTDDQKKLAQAIDRCTGPESGSLKKSRKRSGTQKKPKAEAKNL